METITHFWSYYNTIYYQTNSEKEYHSDFKKFNIYPTVFFNNENSQVQKDILYTVCTGMTDQELRKNIKVLKNYKDLYGNDVIGLKFNPYKSRYYNDFIKKLTETKIQLYGSNISKLSILVNDDIRIDNSKKRIWFLDIEIDNFTREELKKENEDNEKESIGYNFDETVEKQKYKIISITLYDTIDKMYYQFVLNPNNIQDIKNNIVHAYSDNKVYLLFKDEYELFIQFNKLMQRRQPEIISGWYSNDFDMPYIINRYYKLKGLKPELFENEQMLSLIEKIIPNTKRLYNVENMNWHLTLPGIELIDYLQIYKKFSMKIPQSYGLDYIQKYEGIEGKPEKKGFMNYYQNFSKFIEYIFKDVEILKIIEDKNNILKMLLQLQETQKIPLYRLVNMSMTVEQMMYHQTWNKQIVFPSNIIQIQGTDSFQGQIVLEPEDKTSKNVIVLDYESLYPNVIRTFNISPETLITNEVFEDYEKNNKKYIDFTDIYSKTDSNITKIGYSLEKEGIIPQTVDLLINERMKYKTLYKNQKDDDINKQEYYLKQWTYKIVLNSIYGFMGFKYSPIFNKIIAESITQGQRYQFTYQKDYLSNLENNEILYGDTDSIFFLNKKINNENNVTEQIILEFQKKIKKDFNEIIQNNFKKYFKNIKDNKYKNYLKIDIDKIFEKVRFFGTKKRYYGYGFDKKEILHGVELVRTDTPDFQKIILNNFFKKQIESQLTEQDFLNEYIKLKEINDLIFFGETKSVTKNNYKDYKIIPYHIRGLLFQKYLGLQVPDLITDKLLILPVKIYRSRNQDMFEEQRSIFNFKSKKLSIEKVYISTPIELVENLANLLKKNSNVELDYQEIFDKNILKKMEQFSDLIPIINKIREIVNKDNLTTDNLYMFGNLNI